MCALAPRAAGAALERARATTLAPVANASPAVQIPDTAYPIPTGALFVAPDGDDTNPGTVDQPFQTVAHAVSVAPAGATIVLRAGIYRESFDTVVRPVTLQPYPHEQAWLSGSDVVSDWEPTNTGWVHHGWTAQFCHSCWASGAVDPNYPLAGWPDQVFFDGVPLTQVASVDALAPGTFFVDYPNQDLYVGSDPTVPTLVEATSRVAAGVFAASAAGSVVRGIGVMQYGPNWNENTTGEIQDLAPNMVFENDVFTQSSNRGLFVLNAPQVTVTGCQFVDNGFTGLYVRGGNFFDMEHNVVDDNNNRKFWDGFSAAAGAGGVKISSSYHVMVRGNTATNNWGNGIWNDVSSYDVDYIDNYAAYNDRNGLYVEITGTAVVASNLSVHNGQAGLKISGGTNVRVYDNTFADNATYQVSVHDDGRDQPDPTKLALGITWDTANNTFLNNILAAPAAGSLGPLLYTENTEKPIVADAGSMITGMDDDLYSKPTATSPSLLAWWIHPAPAAIAQYGMLPSFTTGTGYEAHGTEVNGYTTSPIFTAPDQGDYSPLAGGAANHAGAPIPSDVAAMIGVTAGVQGQVGALVYPNSSSVLPPPPPPPPPPPTVYATDSFSRVVTGGWGKATKGGAWAVKPATAAWSVNGSTGSVTGTTGQTLIAGISPARVTSADFAVTFTSTAPASAQPKWSFIVRNVDGQHQYRARVRVTAKGVVLVAMTRLTGTGADTLLTPETPVPGITWAPGTQLRIRAEAVGTAPATVQARVWAVATTEPSVWNVSVQDATAGIQSGGTFGVIAVAQAGATGASSTFTFDDVSITAPS